MLCPCCDSARNGAIMSVRPVCVRKLLLVRSVIFTFDLLKGPCPASSMELALTDAGLSAVPPCLRQTASLSHIRDDYVAPSLTFLAANTTFVNHENVNSQVFFFIWSSSVCMLTKPQVWVRVSRNAERTRINRNCLA